MRATGTSAKDRKANPKVRLADVAKGFGPYVGAAALLAGVRASGVSQSMDLLLYDLITTIRPAEQGRTMPITIVGITEKDIQRHGWPIDDRLLCQAIDRLSDGGAMAIGFDLYRDRGVGVEQACLRERFRRNPKLISIFNAAEGIGAVPGTPKHRQSYNDMSVDRDGVLRRDLVHVAGQDEATVAFPLRVYEVGTGDRSRRKRLEANTAEGSWLKKDSGGYDDETDAGLGMQRMLQFRQPGSFRQWSLSNVLDGDVTRGDIDGKLVLLGSTAGSLKDVFEIPHSRFSGGKSALRVPGVEIHAQRTATLIDEQQGRYRSGFTMPGEGGLAITLLMAAVGIWMGEAFRSLRRSVVVVVAAAGIGAGVLVALQYEHIWIDAVMPVAALLLMATAGWLRRGAASQQHQQQILRLLGQNTSPAVAQQLWEQRDELLSDGRFEGRLLPVTVLFTDTANFTKVSERSSPSELLTWLNRGMAYCVPAITQRGGMVNKFTGDGMLAVFGAPVSQGVNADARAGIEAALSIASGLEQLNQELKNEGLPAMRIRIGIHSGNVLAGSMGSQERLEYAIIGDAVNCASRLESLEKFRHDNTVRILVSSSTRELLGEFDQSLPWREWGDIQVKGRDEAMCVSELRTGIAPAAE